MLDLRKNLGNTDRIIRSIIGIILLWLVISKSLTGWWTTIALVFAVFQFVEAVWGY
ncbi:YgaP-like transmembrane domain [Sporomusa malonica]|uniref:Inner membrane protein YgaP-like transmembrane domain-containing protein n=1 Tax=Sporomusa malonica TaxID=112901 RepID=A0A1W1Z7Q0_9FIRM|nr:YgaP-like transmembrane domain [Sporomusa malonica]SMC44480.1 Protein of unknown function [Sporomusa malonica]